MKKLKNLLLDSTLIKEINIFFLFFLILLTLISFIFYIQSESKAFQFADGSISNEDFISIKIEKNFFKEFSELVIKVISFNFGKTEFGENVISHIFQKLIPTLQISIISTIFGFFIGVISSVISIYYSNTEKFFSFLYKVILSTPIFVVCIFLFLFFFYYLAILPPGGYKHFNLEYLILPSIALGSRIGSRLYFFSLEELKKELNSDFVFFFRAMGFTKLKIYFYYLPRKIFPLIFVLLILDFCSLLSGSIIVEEFFYFPGIGKSMFYSAKTFDKNLLQGILVYTGIIFYSFTRIAKHIQSRIYS